ncbi:thiol oxidoreductase [Oleomonas cavernae]|uniref:Thiol oxidoreductase n=1 Tax=Oleomonas cavernae TaxID=2320859 RepID=A0A418WD77_9PROT|nr:di-heme oxidoredictase family protein [Oleomonas cavernae]RJF87991.1 thiol oxidoreductase [Oleomonas cavernae]
MFVFKRMAICLSFVGFFISEALAQDDTARIAAVTAPVTSFDKAEPFEENSAGAATSSDAAGANAFILPSANMAFARRMDFELGNALFMKLWASSPSSTTASDGLGPLYNARSCQSCHLKDGRGVVPAPGQPAVSLFLRLSVPPRTPAEEALLRAGEVNELPEPTYGIQLQNFAVTGIAPEGRMTVAYQEVPITLGDGEIVSLRRPSYGVAALQYGPMAPDVMLSPRVAPPMIGLGLLEAIPAEAILAHADPDDRDGDGISGRPNRVGPERRLGRFGWKAGQPDVALQTAHAFAGDLGLSTPLVGRSHGDCMPAQAQCLAAATGDDPAAGIEVTTPMFDLAVFYARNLAVPARRGAGDAQVLAGKKLFYEIGCISCHVPKFVTARDDAAPEQSFQLIWPYSDLLLHDMGDGLADNRPEGAANGREWRTPPLWAIGLTAQVSGRTEFLHDGRARSLLEAILWHGGEGQRSRDAVVGLSRAQRESLIDFLNSL